MVPGAPAITPAVPEKTITPEPIKDKPKQGATAAPATIVVSLPNEAKLMIDGVATTSTSARRVFVSPELNPGQDYHYNLKVEFVQDGKKVELTKKVTVSAGNESTVSFEATEPSVASR
jgi:uncharacterized protein (TIGR03000 family)